MPKWPCKGVECKKWIIIPPNRIDKATGFCKACYHELGIHKEKAKRNHGPDGKFLSQ